MELTLKSTQILSVVSVTPSGFTASAASLNPSYGPSIPKSSLVAFFKRFVDAKPVVPNRIDRDHVRVVLKIEKAMSNYN